MQSSTSDDQTGNSVSVSQCLYLTGDTFGVSYQVVGCLRVCTCHSLNHNTLVQCSQTEQRESNVEVTSGNGIVVMTLYSQASAVIVLVCAVAGAVLIGVAKRLSLGWRILLGTFVFPNTRLLS